MRQWFDDVTQWIGKDLQTCYQLAEGRNLFRHLTHIESPKYALAYTADKMICKCCKQQNQNAKFYCETTIYCKNYCRRRQFTRTERRCESDLPAKTSESTKMMLASRIILAIFRASSTPVMRMLITMLPRLTTLATAELRLCRSLILTSGPYYVTHSSPLTTSRSGTVFHLLPVGL